VARNQRRHKTGIGYGHTYYSKNVRADFSEIKYKLNLASLKSKAVEFNSEKLSAAERIQIKNNIRKSNKVKTVRILIIKIVSTIVLIIIAIEVIEGVLFRH
jgi:hypothetical protein